MMRTETTAAHDSGMASMLVMASSLSGRDVVDVECQPDQRVDLAGERGCLLGELGGGGLPAGQECPVGLERLEEVRDELVPVVSLLAVRAGRRRVAADEAALAVTDDLRHRVSYWSTYRVNSEPARNDWPDCGKRVTDVIGVADIHVPCAVWVCTLDPTSV